MPGIERGEVVSGLLFVTKSRQTYKVFDRQLRAFLPEGIGIRGFCLDENGRVDCSGAEVALLSTEDVRDALDCEGPPPRAP